jgi:hypothetical protein
VAGCRSFAVALGSLVAGALLGALLGAPSGLLGVIGGVVILPWALVMGTIGWGAVSVPWLFLRFFVSTLPELATVRAFLGFLTVTPLASAWAGWYLASTARVAPLLQVLELVAFGLAAVPFAALVAFFGRDGMRYFMSSTVVVAEA